MNKLILNKKLYTDISRLKNLNTRTDPKFILDQSPFRDDDDEEGNAAADTSKDVVVIGRILPKSEVYNQGAYQIEMKITSRYPYDPPEVRFITPIYHPNVARDGRFCYELLQRTSRWTMTTRLVDVIISVVSYIDNPEIDYSISIELGREYLENRSQFNRNAMEYVKKYALSRSDG